MTDKHYMDYYSLFNQVLIKESMAIESAVVNNNQNMLNKMVEIFNCLRTNNGSLITVGMGKSGIVAQKISSTFSSLGLPSFYLNPTEVLHGDIGRVRPSDAILIISKSGSTEEILKALPFMEVSPEFIIGLLGNVASPLANKCTVIFNCSVIEEACQNIQAPTTSTTVTLAIGDALAVIYEKLVGLSKEGVVQNYSNGFLGQSLSLKVSDLMVIRTECPIVTLNESLQEVILQMTRFPVGLCAIIDNNKFLGIIVEGDIRRTLSDPFKDLQTAVKDIYNPKPVSIISSALAFTALEMMESREHPLNVLPVLDHENFVGVLRIQDLFKKCFSKK